MSAEINMDDLEYFLDRLNKVTEPTVKKKIRKFLMSEGNSLKKKTVAVAKSRVNKHTGNYLKGIKRGKVYLYQGEAWSIRTYNTMPHAHLIEYGHRIVTKDGREIGYRKPKKVFEYAHKQYEDDYLKNTDNFIDEILNEGLGF